MLELAYKSEAFQTPLRYALPARLLEEIINFGGASGRSKTAVKAVNSASTNQRSAISAWGAFSCIDVSDIH